MGNKIKQPVSKGVAKVPVVMQLEALECGAASLTMVLAYYGKWLPLEKVRVDCGVCRDGSNAKNVLKAARFYGLEAKGFRLEPDQLKEDGIFPCIIHWNFNHFVVLDGFRGNKAYINDPARGAVSVSMDEFDESFTGICLMFEPGESFEPGGKPKSIMGFAKKMLKGMGPAIAFVALSTVISSLLGIVSPVFSRIFLDRLLTNQNPEWFTPFMYALAGVFLLQVIVQLFEQLTLLKIGGKMSVVGNTSFMWKVLRLPMVFFTQRMSGDILSRQTSNETVANTLVMTLAPLVLDTAMMVFYLVVMVRYSWILTLVGLASVIINFAMSGIIAKKRVNISRVLARDEGKLSGTTTSGVQMIETIKASGAEDGFFEKWSGYKASASKQDALFVRADAYLSIIPSAVSAIADVMILGLGVFLTIKGNFTLGMIMAFQGFVDSFMAPAENLISANSTIQEMRTQMERIEDIMEYPDDASCIITSVDENTEYSKLSGNIEIKDLTFGYAPLAAPLIKNFNISIKAGERVAFVGPSGCGKSTLSKLISGLQQPWSGSITFDGKTVNEIDHSVFTGSVAVVDQDIIVFEDTIASNIKMWDNSIEDFEMILAARDAQIHDDIIDRPDGYNHKLVEGGKDFSGGQRQRLEIARVLAQDPTVIILDEATSALDARTEFDVVKSIKDRGITCIVIAHRLSTIRDCDEIVVLEKGEVVERGTHDELMALGGYYTKLITSE